MLRNRRLLSVLFFCAFLFCGAGTAIAQSAIAEALSDAQAKSLKSFKRINDHPLFEMTLHGDYDAETPLTVSSEDEDSSGNWACSIFVSYGKNGEAVYGRNFDWLDNPAMILHTNPSDGYASISMVDISYYGFVNDDRKFDTVEGRKALLNAWSLPFDGMNEHGLTVGMAAVGATELPRDETKDYVGSLQIIRLMLDKTKTVDEAIKLFDKYNIHMRGGPNIHYLIADVNGNSALVELKDGKINIHRGQTNWQSATNFYMTGESKPLSKCWRFAKINKEMKHRKGALSTGQTFDVLKNVAQKNTQWSIVYDMKRRSAEVSTGREFEKRHKIDIK